MSNIRKFNLSKSQYIDIVTSYKQGKSIRAIANEINVNPQTLRRYLKEVDEKELVDGEEVKNQILYSQLVEELNNSKKEISKLEDEIRSLISKLNKANDKINELNNCNKHLTKENSMIKEIENKVNDQEINNDIQKIIMDIKNEKMLAKNPFNNNVNEKRLEAWNNNLMEYDAGQLFFDKALMIRINPFTGSLLKYGASNELLKVISNEFKEEYFKTLYQVKDMLPYINEDWDAKEKFNEACRNFFELYKENDKFIETINSVSI